jgi:uncharacterized surface protein with fasciclin (FAS1) repeats
MIRTTIAGVAAAALVATGLAVGAPAQADSAPVGDTNPYDFDIVTEALQVTGLDKTLNGLEAGSGYTAFLPNDRAFEVLAKNLGLLEPGYTFGATVDEDRIFTAVAGLGEATLVKVLTYHVVPGAPLDGAKVLAGSRYKELTTANGQKVKVYVVSKTAPYIILGDKDGRFFNDYVVKSKINVVDTDKVAVHGISDVLLPTL